MLLKAVLVAAPQLSFRKTTLNLFAGANNEKVVDNFNLRTEDLLTDLFTDKEDPGRGITTVSYKEIQARNDARIPQNTKRVDCSQSPYFSVGLSRPVRFDGTAAILVCKSERDLGRVSKLPRGAGVGVSIVREGKRKNRGTVTASHRLAFKRPVAPATATPHRSIRQ